MKMHIIMKKLVANYLFFLIFLSSKLSYICIACPEIEKQSLFIFKQSLKDPSNLLSSWKLEVDCCKWKGVACSNFSGHIRKLDLRKPDSSLQGLIGEINPSLLNLKHLEYLDLSQNQFKHTIPSFIGSLTRLEYLNLSDAGFYGKIPYTIGNLSNLRTLILEETDSLDVDSLEWLSGLSKLEHLNMNFVSLGKTSNWLQQVIYKLPSLVELHLSHCSLNSYTSFSNSVSNISTSSLAILDLSSNNLQSSDTLRLIFQLSNLIFLDLSVNYFEGPIPNKANTTKLKHIDLSVNSFNASIPEWIYLCKDLEFVSLSGNHLQKELSDSIANLTSLKILDLSYNNLSGKIPRKLANLCRLEMLDLGDNKLYGEVSDSFGNMCGCFLESLEYLYLSTNQLSGRLSPRFGEFKRLRTLDVSANSLSGEIPNSIGNLSTLEYLYLVDNKLTGNLPESVGRLSNLIEFGVSDNMLEGIVTETHFAYLSKLKHLYVSRTNQLTLNVSLKWTPPFELKTLRLGSFNLGKGFKIPSWLETQRKTISDLDLSCTGISGDVPGWIWNIRFLNLSHNKLHGKIPFIKDPADDNYGVYRLIYLSSNNFSGSLPRVANIVTELDLSNNSFSGYVSHFFCHTMNNETNGLSILNLAGNCLTGELPDCWTKWPLLRMLNLGNNNLSSTIPNSIGFLANLESLNLFGNNFSGRIPFQLQNCTALLKIDLSGNNLEGNVPTWIGTRLSKLKFLILRSNKLSGEITSTLCQLSSLQILDLSDNRLSGTIPRCVDNFTAMSTKVSQGSTIGYSFVWSAVMDSASVATKGSELEYDTILPLVTLIDFSNNRLFGYIPDELTSLTELRSLNLSRNRLTGPIPERIGNMKQLESLDLSINSLSGTIPSSFRTMTSLSYLNLSCNNMTGKIPDTTQLRGFNKSSFIRNDLCGPPLTKSCGDRDDMITPEPKNGRGEDEEGDEPEIKWLYVFVYLGYLVGLSPFLLIVKRTWRHAYYEFLEDMWDTFYVYFLVIWRRLITSFHNTAKEY